MDRLSPGLLGLPLLLAMFISLTTQANDNGQGSGIIAAPGPSQMTSQAIRGTLYTHTVSSLDKQYTCKVMLANDGLRYEIRGLRQVVDGTSVVLTGSISPAVRPRCSVALMMNVFSSSLIHMTAEPANKPQRFVGTVRRQDMAGKCWRLDTDFGKPFVLRGGDSALYRDGLNVILSGKTHSTALADHRTCPITMAVEVSHYQVVEREQPYHPTDPRLQGQVSASGETGKTGEIARLSATQ